MFLVHEYISRQRFEVIEAHISRFYHLSLYTFIRHEAPVSEPERLITDITIADEGLRHDEIASGTQIMAMTVIGA